MKHLLIWLVAFSVPSAGAEFPRETIAALRAEIMRHDELYHRKAAPEISDAEYDVLKRKLAELERAHPGAGEPALRAVGDDRSGLFRTVEHGEPMLSLDKANAPEELKAFAARVEKAVERGPLEYVVEPKYDGLAVSLTYERGMLVRAVTRGNGSEGDDVTLNVRELPEVPGELREADARRLPERVEIRGEVFVPFAEFQRVNAERELGGEPRFATPRNLAAGTIRQLDPSVVASRGLRVVFFGVGACEPLSALPETQRELHGWFAAWGLPVPTDVWAARGADELVRAVGVLGRVRERLEFPTDGAVVKLNSIALQRELGASEAAPRWALAYKFAPARAETQVRAITLQVGRTGVLTPVAELAPVELGGVVVTRATLHNRDEIGRRDVREGDFVWVERAGDVIPAIVGVNVAKRPAEAKPFVFPTACPECRATLVSRAGEAAVRCANAGCPAQLRRRLEHFASKSAVEIEGLGPAMIETLVSNGWVKELPDLYRLRRADLLTLGRDNARSIDRLLAAIERSKQAELWRVIHGLGIPQIGAAAAKDLARRHGSLEAFAAAEARGRDVVAGLLAAGMRPTHTMAVGRSGLLADRVFVLTGTLPTLTRAQATAVIEAEGGKVAGAVSRSTSYVVAGSDAGSKLEQARKLEVPVIDERELRRMVGER